MEIYRVTKDSPDWLFKAYDYARTDAFCFGQGIPIEMEFGHDAPADDTYEAVVLVEDHKPVAGCRLYYPREDIGRIGRVCVTRDRQKSGVGHILIEEAEKWIREKGINHIVIDSQDRAAAFYERCGYKLVPGVDPRVYEDASTIVDLDKALAERSYVPVTNPLGFSCVLVEKVI